ncbi:hypothetical protein ACFL4T_00310 [candidate division KSB1 bacterium]
MSDLQNIFCSDSEIIEISGIKALAGLCRFQPGNYDKFLSGLELAEDMKIGKGVTLYTKGTFITPERIERLLGIKRNHPEVKMLFKIKRSKQLLDNFKSEIINKFKKLISLRKNYKVYYSFFCSVEKEVISFLDEILYDENNILSIYKLKFTADTCPDKVSTLFFDHSALLAVFTCAIAKSEHIRNILVPDEEDMKDLIKASIHYNSGAINNINIIMQTNRVQDKKRIYHNVNRMSVGLINNINLGNEAREAMSMVAGFYSGDTTFINNTDNKASVFANIMLVADLYLQREAGLFGNRNKPSHIVDNMNVLAMNNGLNINAVKALTIGLNLKEIFDFYLELQNLQSMCDFEGGNHAVPYPLTGFKSPTIFVCKDQMDKCNHHEKSLKAVNLVQPLGTLKEGRYARCLPATDRLLEFYKTHYDVIKTDFKKSSLQ